MPRVRCTVERDGKSWSETAESANSSEKAARNAALMKIGKHIPLDSESRIKCERR